LALAPLALAVGALLQVIGRAIEVVGGALRLALGLGEVALAEQAHHLLRAVARPLDVLAERALRTAGRDAGEPLLELVDLLALALEEVLELPGEALADLGLLALREPLRLLLERALVALDLAHLLHEVGDDAVLLGEALGAEAVEVLVEHLAQAAQIVAELGER